MSWFDDNIKSRYHKLKLSLSQKYIYIYIYHCFLIISMLATHGTNLPIIKEKASWNLLEFVYNFLSIPSMLVNFHNALRSIIISSIKCLNFIYIYIYILCTPTVGFLGSTWLGLDLTWTHNLLVWWAWVSYSRWFLAETQWDHFSLSLLSIFSFFFWTLFLPQFLLFIALS